MNERHQDFESLRRFSREGEQSAFADVVRRHFDLVFGTALRKVEESGAAQEVAQNVFTALARKAWTFAPDDSLPAWLHKTALLESKSWLRGELRRRRREQTAANLGTTMNSPENQTSFHALLPALDEALLSLREKDRTALLLRFYERRTLREVGAAFGVSEDTAQKRVQTALEKLTECFRRRGFKTASVVTATAALQGTAASASASMVSTVVSAALEAAPPALTGLGVWFAKLASLSRTQTAAVCAVLVLAPVGWQLKEQHAAREEVLRIRTQLTEARSDASYLEAQNEQWRATSAALGQSLAEADAAATRVAESAQAFESWKQRIRGPLLAADYRWNEDSEFIRIPKALLPELGDLAAAHTAPFSAPGIVRPYARELMSLSPMERQKMEATLQRVAELQGRELANVTEADPPVRAASGRASSKKVIVAAREFGYQAPGETEDEAGQLLAGERFTQLLASLRNILGEERWRVMPDKFRTNNCHVWNPALMNNPSPSFAAKVEKDDSGLPKAFWMYSGEFPKNPIVRSIEVDAVDPLRFGNNHTIAAGYSSGRTNLSTFLPNTGYDASEQAIKLSLFPIPEAVRQRMSEWFQEQAVRLPDGKENP